MHRIKITGKIYFPLTPSIYPAVVDTTVSWKLHNRSEAVNSTCYDFFHDTLYVIFGFAYNYYFCTFYVKQQ